MPAPLHPKDEVIARIAQTFKKHGYEGASLRELSDQTGLVKASLYHYFPGGKKGMADAALDAFAEKLTKKVIEPLQTEHSPQLRLVFMLEGMDEVYNSGDDLCLFALLSVGDPRALFAEKITAKVGQLVGALATTLCDAGLTKDEATDKTEQFIVEIEGALLVSRIMGDRGVFQRTLRRLKEQVANHSNSSL